MNYQSVVRTFRNLWAFDNRWQLLFERALFRRTSVQIYRLGQLEMLVDNRASDAGSIQGCMSTDMYSRFFSHIPFKSIRNVCDFGANVGGFSLLLLSRGVKIDKLLCVELNPNTCDRLRYNIFTNLLNVQSEAKCEVVNAAVCNEEQSLVIKLGRGSTADNMKGTHQSGQIGREFEVDGTTIDILANRMFEDEIIDLCKMDIEGAEEDVILGMESKVLSSIRFLLIEIHHARSVTAIIDHLNGVGLIRVAGENDVTLLGVSLFENKANHDKQT